MIFTFSRANTVFTEVIIRRARAGSTVRMTCTGRGCKFKSRTRRVRRDRRKLTLSNPLRGARLRPGARFEVRVTLPGTIGLIQRYTVRRGKRPARSDLCLGPGARRPARCPA
ncbi:MAG: hypothetical protein ACRDQ2_08225 [Gaiellales bacterium]